MFHAIPGQQIEIPPPSTTTLNLHSSTTRAGAVNLTIGGLIAYLKTDMNLCKMQNLIFSKISCVQFRKNIDCFQCLVISN